MKSHKWVKISVFILLAVFYGSLLLHQIKLPNAVDLAMQIKDGELISDSNFKVLTANLYSYTEPDFPFVNHHWLSGVVFYLIYQIAGFKGLTVFAAIILLSAFALFFYIAVKKADFWLVAPFSILTILILRQRTDVRPEIFSYFLIALFLYCLLDFKEHSERNKIFWLIPLEILWVNLHIFFSIGIALVAGFLAEGIIIHRKNIKRNLFVKKLTMLLAILATASLINPNGIYGALRSFYQWRAPAFPMRTFELQSITEFLRINLLKDNISIIFFWLAVPLLALSFISNHKRKPVFFVLASIATTIIGFSVIRGLALFGFIFLPAVSHNFQDTFIKIKNSLKTKRPQITGIASVFFIAILVVMPVYLTVLGWKGKISVNEKPGIGLTPHSNDSAIFFKAEKLRGPIFNDGSIGSYLTYHLYPQESVFVDNRWGDAYPASIFNTYLAMLAREDVWQKMLKQYDFNVIFFYWNDGDRDTHIFLKRRMADPAWSLVHADTYAVILLRNTPENQAVIQKFRITKENIEQRLPFLLNSADADYQIAVADISIKMGRNDLAMAIFKKVVTKWPEKGRVWMAMGELEAIDYDSESAIRSAEFLEKAISVGQKTAEAYSFLGLAYVKIGEYDKAREALRKALKINPDREDAQKLLDSFQTNYK